MKAKELVLLLDTGYLHICTFTHLDTPAMGNAARGQRPHLLCSGRSRSRATVAGKMPASPGRPNAKRHFLGNALSSDHQPSEQLGNRTSDHGCGCGALGESALPKLCVLCALCYLCVEIPALRLFGAALVSDTLETSLWCQTPEVPPYLRFSQFSALCAAGLYTVLHVLHVLISRGVSSLTFHYCFGSFLY